MSGRADYLVTDDDDLLALRGDLRLGVLQIVTVAQFLVLLEAKVNVETDENG